jgi:hypothetical protein
MPIVHVVEAFTNALAIVVIDLIVHASEASQTPMPSGHLDAGHHVGDVDAELGRFVAGIILLNAHDDVFVDDAGALAVR